MTRTLRIAALALALAVFAAPSALAGLFGPAQSNIPPELAAKLDKPVPQSLITTLEQASKAGLGLGVAPGVIHLKAISGQRLNKGNKPGLLYIGADFCPYCAGQRWALILTLVRFGKLTGLGYMFSASRDVYPNTVTFSFLRAHYVSPYLAFRAVETQDRNYKPLMKMTAQEQKIFNTFDAPPYTQVFGGIPFIYLDGQYMLTTPMLLPSEIIGRRWNSVATELANPQSKLFQKVMPQVNLLSAAICRLNGGNPNDVCSAPGIIAANGALLRLGNPGRRQ